MPITFFPDSSDVSDGLIVGGTFVDVITSDDVAKMRVAVEDALALKVPLIFLWDLSNAHRTASPNVRLDVFRMRTDLLSELTTAELGTLLVLPTKPVSRALLRIIVRGLPGSHGISAYDSMELALESARSIFDANGSSESKAASGAERIGQ